MWPLAILMGAALAGSFYKTMFGRFSRPNKSGRINEMAVGRTSTACGL